MSKTRFDLYREFFEDTDNVYKKEFADIIGVTEKTLYNYLREKTTMPLNYEIVLINFINEHSDKKTLYYTLLPLQTSNKSPTVINISIEEIEKQNKLLDELKKLEKQYSIPLFEEVYNTNFKLLQLSFGKDYFKKFIEELTQLFIEKKSIEYKTNEIDSQFIESIQQLDCNEIAKKLNDYYKNKTRYGEYSLELLNIENKIKDSFDNFIQKLYNDYKNT